MGTEWKFCKDCKWFPSELASDDTQSPKCQHALAETSGPPDLVTGIGVSVWKASCAMLRYYVRVSGMPEKCGQEAIWFEPRE